MQDKRYHLGGYNPFTLDITDYLKTNTTEENEFIVGVYDPTESSSSNGSGKQDTKRLQDPTGITYASTSGIWDTVWIECVPQSYYIEDLKFDTSNPLEGVQLHVTVWEDPSIRDNNE